MYIKIIGLTAAALTTFAFLPQAIKTWKTKSTDDLSPAMFGLLCTGILLWLIYGLLVNDLPIILANSVTLVLACSILYYIIKPGHAQKIKHVALWTSNLEEMKDFYCHHFKATCSMLYKNPTSGFQSYFINFSSGASLELMYNKNSEQEKAQLSGHFCISVGSKKRVDEFAEHFRKEKIEILKGPRVTGDGYYEFLFRDTEGNLVEVTV
ncbi:MAG: SemiSWEET transporter [Bacteroidota bacterium]|nr:MAG: SemiSWEET transporter [Bacteroidota bacterium]